MAHKLVTLILGIVSFVALSVAYIPLFTEMPVAAALHFLLWAVVINCIFDAVSAQEGSFSRATVSTFFFLFAIIAPAIQLINNSSILVNTMTLNRDSVAGANLQFLLFVIFYRLYNYFWPDYFILNSNRKIKPAQKYEIKNQNSVFLFFIFSLIFAVVAWIISSEFLEQRLNEQDELQITPEILIKTKFIGFMCIPILMYAIIMCRSVARINVIWISIIIISFFGVLISQNPFLEKRQSIGPVYLSIVAIVFRDKIRGGLGKFLFIFLPTVILMPTLAVLTHSDSTKWGDAEWGVSLISSHFIELHYDAWSNAMAAFEMVEKDGLSWGRQLFGTLLFWVPRGIFLDKPLMSGTEIAYYLEAYYAMWFYNLSAPAPSEGYLDFWYFGCIIYGVFLAKMCNFFDRLSVGHFGAAYIGVGVYFSFFLMFFLRGAMMNAVAYGVGNFLAFFCVAWIVKKMGCGLLVEPVRIKE